MFEERLSEWAAAACREWEYPAVPDDFLDLLKARLPVGLREALEIGFQEGTITSVDNHRFTLKNLAPGKGPYSWFSKSPKQVPAPNWEYFVQAATFARLHSTLTPKGYSLVFEDDLMDIAVYRERNLVICCEVKEKASQLPPLLREIQKHSGGFDPVAPDRGNDGLRKAKYIVRARPKYFALVAIGQSSEFSVSYPEAGGFQLVEDLIPVW